MDTPPSAIAQQHRDAIVNAAAAHLGVKPSALTLMPEETFALAGQPGVYGFMVLHQGGFVGIRGKVDGGALTELRVMEL